MSKRTPGRVLLVCSAIVLSSVYACGGDATSATTTGGAGYPLCDAIASYANRCGGAAGSCDQALAADCNNFVGLLGQSFVDGVLACLQANPNESPTSCLA